MKDSPGDRPADCVYVVGDDGLSHWPQVAADAWIGLLQTQRQLTRQLDAELEARHGLSLSALELLGRLAADPEHCVRLSALAEQVNLSLSRVSRIIDALQSRGLVERRQCQMDARAINAELTAAGLELAREAQRTHFAGVQERFFDRLSPEEVATLAGVFNRFAPGAARACSAQARTGSDAPAKSRSRRA
jgi:DNA-binding MarR family transcriptional regulator